MENPCWSVLCRDFFVTKVLHSVLCNKKVIKFFMQDFEYFFAGIIKYTTFVVQKNNKR